MIFAPASTNSSSTVLHVVLVELTPSYLWRWVSQTWLCGCCSFFRLYHSFVCRASFLVGTFFFSLCSLWRRVWERILWHRRLRFAFCTRYISSENAKQLGTVVQVRPQQNDLRVCRLAALLCNWDHHWKAIRWSWDRLLGRWCCPLRARHRLPSVCRRFWHRRPAARAARAAWSNQTRRVFHSWGRFTILSTVNPWVTWTKSERASNARCSTEPSMDPGNSYASPLRIELSSLFLYVLECIFDNFCESTRTVLKPS